MNVSDRIRQLAEEHNLSGTDIGTLLGLSKSPMTDWKNGKSNPTLEQITKICEHFAISSDYLLFGGETRGGNQIPPLAPNPADTANLSDLDDIERQLVLERIESFKALKQAKAAASAAKQPAPRPRARANKPKAPHKRHIKLFTIPAAAGRGNDVSGDGPSYTIEDFPSADVPDSATCAVRIEGDSMEPLIKDGSVAWVKEGVIAESGEVGIFTYKDVAYCKELLIDPENGEISLLSVNPDYAPVEIEDVDSLYCLGKVILPYGRR